MGDYIKMEDGDHSSEKKIDDESDSDNMTWGNVCVCAEYIVVAFTLALFCLHLRSLNEIECELTRLNTNLENL